VRLAGGANLFRCKQSQVATKKLDELNARRLELQQEQDELKKRRVLVAAEAAKERAEAGLCACARLSRPKVPISPLPAAALFTTGGARVSLAFTLA